MIYGRIIHNIYLQYMFFSRTNFGSFFVLFTFIVKNSGAYMEKRFSGIRAVILQGMSIGSLDLTLNQWGHKVRYRDLTFVSTKRGQNTMKIISCVYLGWHRGRNTSIVHRRRVQES